MAIQIVSYRCVLKNTLGQVISRTYSHNVIAANSPSGTNTLSALVDALKDLRAGETRHVCLRADQAYGFYDPKLVVVREIDGLDFSAPVTVGEEVAMVTGGKKRMMRVTEINDESVTLDGNHPLAGQDLVFEIEATEARDATAEELNEAEDTDSGSLLH